MSATHLLNENWFYALECEAALKSTSLAPFAARPASQFKHFKRAANLAYFDMRSEAKEKNQISEPATPAEATPHFKVIPLGDNHQRHASLNLPTSTPSHIPTEEHDEYHPFPMPVIASGWWPPSPTPTSPNIEDADDLGLTRTPPAKSHYYMDGLFSPCSITASPSPSPSPSASSDDKVPCNGSSLRRSTAPAVKSSDRSKERSRVGVPVTPDRETAVDLSEDHHPKLFDDEEATLDKLRTGQCLLSSPLPQSTSSAQFLNHPASDNPLQQPGFMVSNDKQREQLMDVIIDVLMDRKAGAWTPMAQLWKEVHEIEPSWSQSLVKEAFRDMKCYT